MAGVARFLGSLIVVAHRSMSMTRRISNPPTSRRTMRRQCPLSGVWHAVAPRRDGVRERSVSGGLTYLGPNGGLGNNASWKMDLAGQTADSYPDDRCTFSTRTTRSRRTHSGRVSNWRFVRGVLRSGMARCSRSAA